MFTKQDQIQATLHGETSLLQSPTSSVLVNSPPFTHLSDSMSGYKVCTQPQHTCTSDISTLLGESDFESIISFDWAEPNYGMAAGTSGGATDFGSAKATPQLGSAIVQPQLAGSATATPQLGSATVNPQLGSATVYPQL